MASEQKSFICMRILRRIDLAPIDLFRRQLIEQKAMTKLRQTPGNARDLLAS